MSIADLSPKKRPRQGRSRAMVDALVEATARLLAAEGYGAATTKRIAAVAGVSVGSLYQYFPNKDALVYAVAQRHFDEVLAQLARVSLSPGTPLPDIVRGFVKAMVASHRMDAGLHRALTEFLLRLGPESYAEQQQRAQAMVRGILELRRSEVVEADLDVASWLLVTTAESAVHAALMEDGDLLSHERFERELSDLLCRYICRQP